MHIIMNGRAAMEQKLQRKADAVASTQSPHPSRRQWLPGSGNLDGDNIVWCQEVCLFRVLVERRETCERGKELSPSGWHSERLYASQQLSSASC